MRAPTTARVANKGVVGLASHKTIPQTSESTHATRATAYGHVVVQDALRMREQEQARQRGELLLTPSDHVCRNGFASALWRPTCLSVRVHDAK